MNRIRVWVVNVLLTVGCVSQSCGFADSGGISSVRTNLSERWITNTTDIYMQVNRFVTEYHTNCVVNVRTNYVDLFKTNVVTRTLTNTLAVEAIHTNFVQAYHTNFQTLHLTNWTTVLAFKTNWVTRPVTNVVQIDLPAEPPATTSAAPAKSAVLDTEPLTLQAARGARATTNNQVEVQLRVTWRNGGKKPVQVQQWRIEREDGSILCFGQDPEFKRPLPVGTYKVSVKAQGGASNPLIAALGTLTVTPQEVLLEQRPARSNSSI